MVVDDHGLPDMERIVDRLVFVDGNDNVMEERLLVRRSPLADVAGPIVAALMSMSIRDIDPHPQPGEGKANRPGTRYVPHQGKRECERRAKQLARRAK